MITDLQKISKFLSLVLRHKPEIIQINLDDNGWVDTDVLLTSLQKSKYFLNLEDLKDIVLNNDKQRFKFNEDYSKIRASQGHTVKVDLNFEKKTPPEILYHGTATKNIESIKSKGLLKKDRHHVHLTKDKEMALKVGMRYGKPIILEILARNMYDNGIDFYLSDNGVWLTNFVDSKYIVLNEK